MNFVKCLLIMQASLLLIAAQHAVLSGNPFMLVKNDFSEKFVVYFSVVLCELTKCPIGLPF